jgi:hypothetical protein
MSSTSRLRRRKSYQQKGIYNETIIGMLKKTPVVENQPKKQISKKKDWINNYNGGK